MPRSNNKRLKFKNKVEKRPERKPLITVEELLRHKDKEFRELEEFVREYRKKHSKGGESDS